jgi:hypothetical protein
MTTFAALPDAQELEALTCTAWTTYSDELRDVDGEAYADAEIAAWDRLQAALRELEPRRPALPTPR